MARGTPKLWFYRVQNGVAHLMAGNVGALARINRARGGRAVKEVERPSVIISVQVDAFVEQHPQGRSRLPIPRRHPRRPEIGTTAQALGRGPVPEARGPGRTAWSGCSSRKIVSERTLGGVGERPRYPNAGLWIVFPNRHLLRSGG